MENEFDYLGSRRCSVCGGSGWKENRFCRKERKKLIELGCFLETDFGGYMGTEAQCEPRKPLPKYEKE